MIILFFIIIFLIIFFVFCQIDILLSSKRLLIKINYLPIIYISSKHYQKLIKKIIEKQLNNNQNKNNKINIQKRIKVKEFNIEVYTIINDYIFHNFITLIIKEYLRIFNQMIEAQNIHLKYQSSDVNDFYVSVRINTNIFLIIYDLIRRRKYARA